MSNATKIEAFRNLVSLVAKRVKVTAHARQLVREWASEPDADYVDELRSATIHSQEWGHSELSALFGGLLAMVEGWGQGAFPPGVWGLTVAELAFSYVNREYAKIIERERAGTPQDWGRVLR